MKLSGIYCPITTPFMDGKVATYKLAENLEKWNVTGLNGYVILGSTGEAAFLTRSEKIEIIKTARPHIAENKKVLVGTGCESTAETIRLTDLAAELGADGALVLTPHYYKDQISEDCFYRHFVSVADSAPIPIVLYNVPKFTGVDLTPAVISRLSEHPNIIGIKDSANKVSKLTEIMKNRASNFQVLLGSYSLFLPGLLLGAQGAILAVANVAAECCVRIYELCVEKSYAQAKQIYMKLLPLAKALTERYGIPAIKAALDLLGFYGGNPREPFLPLTPEKIDEINTLLKEAELL